ncbi:TonB family protein [Novosphingobium sp. MMS21-SN21R]|uniref:energy transducer TonB n=1 Tax=Novosphingobium sp. MMS21-SN21R TaxID=2969298 RepID=UPI00288836E3|nr:TonB family protein [Novosphingobium sp. MMS21-SN21R]MDT0507318.1 TonB family protein [Novosphingobium sp. MMS21-SN21R]
MAYLIEDTGRKRAQTFVAVALLHGAGIWAIASGFAGGVVNIVRDTLVARQWQDEVKITPIAPPDVKPPEARTDRTVVAPKPDIVLAKADPGFTIREIDVPEIPPAGDLVIEPKPQPSPLPSATPSYSVRGAAPKSAPGSWVSDRDYPSAAIREEREGVTRFRLAIGPDGRVTGCEVTGSSGSADLDAATCAKVSARARFTPALGSDGMPAAGSYSGAVRWILP